MKRAAKKVVARTRTNGTKAVELSELFDLLDQSDSLFSYRAQSVKGFEQNSVAYAAIMGLARATSQVPWCLYSGSGEEPKEIEEHPLIDLMERPNPQEGGRRFVHRMVIHLYVGGKAFIHRASQGDEEELAGMLRLLQPDRMKLKNPYSLDGGWTYTNLQGKEISIPAADVLPLFLPDPDNELEGLSPLRPAATAIIQGNRAREWNANLLGNNARPPGILKGKWDMNAEQKKKALKQWLDQYGGFRKAGSPVLQGDLEWESVAQTAQELEWLQGMRLADRSVAVAIGYAPQLLGDKDAATYSNYQEARRSLYEDHVIPLLTWILEDLNVWLVKPFGEDLYFTPNLDGVTALKEGQDALWKRVLESDSLTLNEKREALGYDQVASPAGDLIRFGTIVVDGATGEVLKGATEPQPVAPDGKPMGEGAQKPEEEEEARSAQLFNVRKLERVIAWKAFDGRRHTFEERTALIARRLLNDERIKALAAIRMAGYSGGAADAAAAEVGKNRPEWERLYHDVYRMVGRDFAQLVFGKVRKSFDGLEVKADASFWDDIVMKYVLNESARKVSGIIDTTRKAIRETLADGIGAGEGIDDLAKRVDTLYLEEIIPHRSEVIARTEVINASNLGSVEAAKATGLVLRKQWISAHDDRTRESHRDADGQIVPMDAPFIVGGSQLMWPGDTSLGAPPEETIQCRCGVAFVTE